MANAKLNCWMQWVLFVGMLVILAFSYGAYNNSEKVNYDKIANLVNVPKVEVPTAEEIANKIVIPEADNQKIEELWKKVYEEEINELKEDALEATLGEIDKEDIEDFLKDKGYNIDYVKSYEVDEEETEIEVINLGLDDEDDKSATVNLCLDVKYKQKTGTTTTQRETVCVTADYYIDDGDEEVDLTYSVG